MASSLLYTTSQGGGKVPTALVALSRLGGSCSLFCTVGDDAAGKFCVQELQDSGVDTRYISVLPGEKTNLTICLAEQETGGRSFIGKYAMRTILPEELDEQVIRSAKLLHLWSVSPAALQAAAWIREAGGKVVFEADRYSPQIEKHLDMIDVFICSEFYFNGMFGTNASQDPDLRKAGLLELQKRGPGIAVVTLGSKGYAGQDQSGYFEGPAFTNIHVVDSTGAGDVFHGAFLFGLLQNWAASDIARFASAVSGIKCTVLGGRAGIPNLTVTEKFMQTGQIDISIQTYWEQYYAEHALL
jgi:sugar/nucleoside kinase (ribokinase family)